MHSANLIDVVRFGHRRSDDTNNDIILVFTGRNTSINLCTKSERVAVVCDSRTRAIRCQNGAISICRYSLIADRIFIDSLAKSVAPSIVREIRERGSATYSANFTAVWVL